MSDNKIISLPPEKPENLSVSAVDRLTPERAMFLHRVILGMLFIASVHLAVFLGSGGMRHLVDLGGYAVFGVFLAIALQLLSRGKIRLSGFLISAALYAGLVSGSILWGGVTPGLVTSFIVLILVAGFSMGSRAGAFSAALVTLTLGTLTVLQVNNLLPPAVVPMPGSAQTTMVGLSLVQAGLMIWYGLRRLESAVRQSEIKEAEAKQALSELRQSQKMEMIGQISAGVAHDFNNLLSAILGSADLIRMDVRGETLSLVDNIIRAGEHGSMLTRQLLSFSRRRPENEKESVQNLNVLVQDVGKLLDRLIGERVRLTLRTCDAPVPVKMDRSNIEQVLFNLAINARDAVQGNGEVRISIEIEKDHWALVSVSDNGVGMSKQVADRIFDPFFTTKAEGRGTGLGLAIVHRIVTEAGGTVHVDTHIGKGTTFQIRLPLSPERVSDTPRLEGILPQALFPARILLLDDNAMLRCAARAVLEKAGCEVLEGESGRRGMALLRERKDIDLVLSDWVMPDMGGAELIREMHVCREAVPVLLMTGQVGIEIESTDATGAVEVLRKPIRPVELMRKVNEILSRTDVRRRDVAVVAGQAGR